MVMHGGNGNGSGANLQISRKQFIDRSEDRDAVFLFSLGGTNRIRLDGGDESDAFAGRFQFAIDTKVIAAEGAGSDDGSA